MAAMSLYDDTKSVKSIKRSTTHTQATDEMPKELDVMAIAYQYFLDEVGQLTNEERKMRISALDALELYSAVQMVHREVANFKLENHIMVDFLEKNDPKLLIGLRYRRASIMKKSEAAGASKHTPQGSLAHNSSRHSSKRSLSMSIHMASSMGGGGTERRKALEYKLNFKAKAELAEKAAAEVERRVTDIERNGRDKKL